MRTVAQAAGFDAENLVERRLRGEGWTILGRNVRVGRAEIDILAVDPVPPRALVAVEVRWRGRRDYGLPEETVHHAKVARLRDAALALRAGTRRAGIPIPRLAIRVDIVAVEPNGRIRHHRHVL